MTSFNELLRALAEEHVKQISSIKEENDTLKRQLSEKLTENNDLQDRLSRPQVVWTGSSASSRAQRIWDAGMHRMSDRRNEHGGGHAHPHPHPHQPRPQSKEKKRTRGNIFSSFRFASLSPDINHRNQMKTIPGEPLTKSQRLKIFMCSTRVEFFVAMLVVANSVISALELQYHGLNVGYHIGYPGVDKESNWNGAEHWFKLIDHGFTLIFSIELILRVFAFQRDFFFVVLNWLDVAAVTVGLMDIFFADETSGAVALRLMRLVKVSRALRLIRLLSFLESLLFLLQCMKASLPTLFWSICVLTVIQCTIGMMISHLVQDYIRGLGGHLHDLQNRREVYMYYGTFTRTIITMFEIHLANWSPACRVLVDNVGEWLGYLFLAYRCLAGFAVLNVINAVFIQQTMKVAQQDHEIKIMQRQKLQDQNQREIEDFFDELDHNGDGQLSREEFNALLTDKKLQAWLSCLEIELSDVRALLEILTTGSQEISAQEFVKRLMSIKGPAKAIDMAQLLARSTRMESKLNRLALLVQSSEWLVPSDELAPNSFDLQ